MTKHAKPEDAVDGVHEILRLSNAFRDNWPEVKIRIVARAGAMLSCYHQIADQARSAGRLAAERDRDLREIIALGDDIVQAFRCDDPPAGETWDELAGVLADTLDLISLDLGFSDPEA